MHMFKNDYNAIPGAFWETLGQYVYGYMEDGKFVYIGKGNGNRALSHHASRGQRAIVYYTRACTL